jgi:hypothetical protein
MAVYPPLPLSVNGRSPFDSVRLRYGGLGSVGLGVGLLFTGQPAGIAFGLLLALLGSATWILSSFGMKHWYDIPTPQRYIVGTGAILGFFVCIVFVGGFLLLATVLQLIARSR